MKKLFYLLLIAGTFLNTTQVSAQNMFSLQYSMGFGTGDVKSYVSSASLRGAALEYRYLIQPEIGIGLDVGWNTFYERRAFDTYTRGTASLSGVQYRSINYAPIYFAGDYFFSPGEKLNPFVGLGVGTIYSKWKTDMGLYALSTETWAFALRPEVGVRVEANPGMDIILAGKYNAGFSTADLPAQSYFTFNIGLVFKN